MLRNDGCTTGATAVNVSPGSLHEMTCDAWQGGANGGQGMNHGRGDGPKDLKTTRGSMRRHLVAR